MQNKRAGKARRQRRIDINERTREAMPVSLADTYLSVEHFLYGQERPKFNTRYDMCEACVQSFDKLTEVIAASPFCIADIMQIPNDGACKCEGRSDCKQCIRSTVYRLLIQDKEESKK